MQFANIGSLDRVLRIIIGALLIGIPLFQSMELTQALPMALIAIGAILVITAFIKFCPIYGIFSLRTNSKK